MLLDLSASRTNKNSPFPEYWHNFGTILVAGFGPAFRKGAFIID